MIAKVNDLTKGAATLNAKSRGVGYRHAAAVVNLAAEWSKRNLNIDDGQNQK